MSFMIYGANGYTGERIAREAVRRGLKPVLAGRNRAAIEALARELGLESRIFDLDAPNLSGVSAVAHCAGPFSATAAPMVEACLKARVHYVDITGEAQVFEAVKARHREALATGIVLIPGSGFDVYPTDCLAATLKDALPDATSLELGFSGLDAVSPGTAKTSVEGLAKGGSLIRRNGVLTPVKLGAEGRAFDFGDGKGPQPAFCIPWGDVSTAHWSTGIANITVRVPEASGSVKGLKALIPILPLLKFGPVQALLKALAGATAKGPDAKSYDTDIAHVAGEVRNDKGEMRRATLKATNGYRLTVDGVLHTLAFLEAGAYTPGYHTPSTLMGADCVTRLPGVSAIQFDA